MRKTDKLLITILYLLAFTMPNYAQNVLDNLRLASTMDIYFESGKHNVTPDVGSQLQQIVAKYKQNNRLKIRITAHTDAYGSQQDNYILSDKRANAVKYFFISQGVPPDALVASTFGKDKPLADNYTENGRKMNRRASVEVYEPAPEVVKVVEKQVIVEKPVVQIQTVEKIVEKPVVQIQTVEKIVEKPVIQIQTVEKIVEKPVVQIQTVEKPVEKPVVQIQTVEIVEKPVIQIQTVEKIVEKPVVQIQMIEKPVVQIQTVEKIVEKPVVQIQTVEKIEKPVVVEKQLNTPLPFDTTGESSKKNILEAPEVTDETIAYLQGVIQDRDTKLGIAALLFVKHLNGKLDSLTTDKDGIYKLPCIFDEIVTIDVFAKGYFYNSEDVVIKPNAAQKIGLQSLQVGSIATITNLYFVGNEATLLKSSDSELAKILRFMTLNKDIAIEIAGHVNAPGVDPKKLPKDEFNISTKRALTIRKFLIQNGFSEEKISSKGYGNAQMPYPEPMNERQEELNRRVEIKVVGIPITAN